MARLILMNQTMSNREVEIPGLGRYKPLRELSEKRITKAVRQVLRKEFGFANVTVSCDATSNDSDTWLGECTVEGINFQYRIQGDLYDSV